MSEKIDKKKVRQISCTFKGWENMNQHFLTCRINGAKIHTSKWVEKAIMNQIKLDQDEK